MKKSLLQENFLILFLLSLIISFSFYDIVFFGKTLKVTTVNCQAVLMGVYGQENNKLAYFPVQSTDASLMEEPLYEFVRKSLQQGIWPLWNPHQACGFPLVANLELGFLFPLNLILYFVPQPFAWDLTMLARIFFAGLFTFWLMRSLRFGRIPSLGAAVLFMLSGPMVLLQYCFTSVDIIAPLLLLTMELLLQRPNLRNAALVALAVALSIFGGHPEHILFVNTFGVLFFAFRIFSLETLSQKKVAVIYLLGAYFLALGLSAVVSFPFTQNFITEFWHSHSGNTAIRESATYRKEIISIIFPYFFQKEPVTLQFDRVGWWGGYLGVLAFALAFLSLFSKQRKGLNYFIAVLAILNITKTYFEFPFFKLITLLPVFRDCRFYPHTAHLFALSMAMLAGMGIRVALLKKDALGKSFVFSIPLLIWTGLTLWSYRTAPHFPISFAASIRGFEILLVFHLLLWLKDKKYPRRKITGVLLLLLIGLELFLHIPRERSRRYDSYPKVPYIEFIRNTNPRPRSYGVFWTLNPNTASAYQIDDLGVFTALLSKRFVNFVNHFLIQNHFKKDMTANSLQSFPINFMPNQRPFLDMLNVRYALTPLDLAKKIPSPAVYQQEVAVYRSEQALPRAFIVHRVIFEPNEDKMFSRIQKISQNFRFVAVVQDPEDKLISQQLAPTPLIDRSQANIVKYTPNEVVLKVTMENPGLVVLSDTFHADWNAFLDKKKTKIYFTNSLVRGVFVPAGTHEVRYIFQPRSFYIGLAVSLLSLVLFIIFVFKRENRIKPIK